jgi:hypothetical protein
MSRDRETVRAALLAKLEATWARYKESPELRRIVESASNAELRKHLAWAECASEMLSESDGDTLSPRYSDNERRTFARLRHARWSPGEFGYVLARDECSWYRGPDWVPFNLWQTAEYGSGLTQQCAATLYQAPGAESLWSAITARYPRPDNLALSLPMVCREAKARWADIPRMTPSEFRAHREKLARHAEQLAVELERFYLHRDPDETEFSGLLDFQELMTQEELDGFHRTIQITTFHVANRALTRADVSAVDWEEYNDIVKRARELGYRTGSTYTAAQEDMKGVYDLLQRDHSRPDWPYGGVPSLPDMMRRIAAKFSEDGEDAPIARPNLANAERNFFARALCKYFWQSRGDISPSIVRDVVTMFYAQGMGENDVSQMAARVKAAYPLPPEPETSGPF